MRVMEFYCGIGGFAAAAPGAEIVAAFDQSPLAIQVYRQNFSQTRVIQCNLETITTATLRACPADLWWLSPPCQPYTLRGNTRDLADPRALSFIHLISLLADLRPIYLGLENVIGFRHSQARGLLLQQLSRCNYQFQERLLCPTEIGIPSRRPRYYLSASQLKPWTPPNNNADHAGSSETLVPGLIPPGYTAEFPSPPDSCRKRMLAEYLDPNPSSGLEVNPDHQLRFSKGFRMLDPENPQAYTTCFTAGYGKSLMHAGSYLKWKGNLRRFSPDEILRLLGFPDSFIWPPELSLRQRWHMAGNSLSVYAVREILRTSPAFQSICEHLFKSIHHSANVANEALL
jgi:DNA (cytosine-5)-methyltransferase 1